MKRIVAFLLIWVALIAGAETYKPVQKGEKWGIQNSAGKWTAKPRYFEILPFGENYFVKVKKHKYPSKEKWALIDRNAKILFSDIQGSFSKEYNPWVLDKNRAIVRQGSYDGIIDSEGKVLLPFEYNSIVPSSCDIEGKVLLPFISNYIVPSSWNDMFTVGKAYRAGLLNDNFEEILPCRYRSISMVITESLDTLWRVETEDNKYNKFYGLYDQKGKEILPCEYEKIKSMETKSLGTVFVVREIDSTRHLKFGLYDSKGKEMLPCTYSSIKKIETESLGTIFKVSIYNYQKNRSNYGLVNGKLEEVLSCEYEEITETDISDVVMVSLKNDRYYFSLISREWKKVNEGGSVLCDNNGCYKVTGPNWQFYYKDGHFYDRENQIPKASAIDSKRPLIHNEMDGMSRLADKVGKETPADVDQNIPKGRTNNENTLCVIIANENYRRESNVEYALNDGEVFRRYCIETFGIPEKNIRFYGDATLNDMRAALGWLSRAVAACGSSSSVIFYYAGHGIPDEATRSAYLLPTDGYGSDVETGYALKNLYATLGKLSAEKVTVFLDACFSGAQRDGKMMASARGVAIKSKAESLQGNTVVLTAASDDETAYPYREKRHGLFTYYLLKKWQETQGSATLGELADYLRSEVVKESVLSNSKSQTPTVSCSPALTGTWKTWKLK